jgi:signal transduction histidine kinase/ligand-binding sensor domain-containing protein/CheY-like chemotaxis protein
VTRKAFFPLGIAFLFVLGAPVVTKAQQHLLGNFSLAEGLPQSQVWDIHQDSRGFVWFATYGGGVARFDGVGFEVFSTEDGLLSNSVFKIHESADGTLWFATRSGVNRMAGGEITSVPGLDPRHKVYDLATDQAGRLWAATEAGAFVLRGGAFHSEGPARDIPVLSLLAARNGELWMGTSGAGLYTMQRGSWLHMDTQDGLPNNTVRALLETPKGDVWIGTDHGAARWDGQTFERIDVSDGLNDNRVWALLEDRLGAIWIGTQAGVSIVDNGVVSPLRSRELQAVPVWSLATDHESNVYIGTSGKGAFVYNHSPFTHMDDLAYFDGKMVWNIAQDRDGDYWFGLEGGIKRFAAGSMDPVPFDDSLFRGRSVRAITLGEGGNLWIGTSRGVFQWGSGKMSEVFDDAGQSVYEVRSIRRGAEGEIWISTLGNGAYLADGSVLRPVDGLVEREIYDVLQASDGSVWFAGEHGLSVMTERGIQTITKEDGLSHDEAITLVEDRFGRIWVGTYGGGLSVIHEAGAPGGEFCIDIVDTGNGLSDDTVLFMAIGPTQDLWVGTNQGLNRVDVSTFDHSGRVAVQRYGQYEGFVGIEGVLHAAFADDQDAMWFGHVAGASRLAPDVVETQAAAPKTLLTDIRLFMEQPDWAADRVDIDGKTGLPQSLELPAGRNHITFDFVALSYRAAERMQYRHMLEGFDGDWSPPHSERMATYSNLAPGSYSFRVQASTDGVTWSAATQGFEMTIQAPIWQRWWFVLVLVAAFLGGLALVFELRTRSLRKRQRDLENTVSERTDALIEAREEALQALQVKGRFLANMSHEIRTPMNGVLGFASILAETDLDKEQKEYVGVIQTSGDLLLGIINDILDYSKIEAGKTRIDTSPFSVRKVVERVLELLSAQAAVKKIELVGDLVPDLQDVFRGDETRLQQVLVNLVANAVKFTQSGSVTVRVEVDNAGGDAASLRFDVIDTGIGIRADRLGSLFAPFTQADASTTREYGGTGLGLAISDRLCTQMGGSLQVESIPGSGSTFHFSIPLPADESPVQPQPSLPSQFAGKRAILATHVPETASAIARQLAYWGVEVDRACGAKESAEVLDSGTEFDIALVDMDMPGSELIEDAFRCPESGELMVPVVTLHSVGNRTQRGDCSQAVNKPVKRSSLFEVFEAAFPKRAALQASVTGGVPTAVGHPQLRILVAEDHPTNRMLISRMLHRLGHDADVVVNGQEAIEAAQRAHYDAVLMDVQMPVMDGLEATLKMRGMFSPEEMPRIIALTAAVLEEDQQACWIAGMDAILKKPLHIDQLIAALAEVTETPRRASDRKARPRAAEQQKTAPDNVQRGLWSQGESNP